MNGYKAFYNNREIDVYAESAFSAQLQAAKVFKAKQTWKVVVVLCEQDTDGTQPGRQVVHRAVD